MVDNPLSPTMIEAALTEAAAGQQAPAEKSDNSTLAAQAGSSDAEDRCELERQEAEGDDASWDWNTDPHNPYNWAASKKATQVGIISSIAFLA